MLYGHITKEKTGYSLRITRDIRGQELAGPIMYLKGKADARKVCAIGNVQPWNF